MYTKLAGFALFVLALVGCVAGPHLGGAAASYPAPELGIIADENLHVVGLDYKSAAGKAGVQVGDILVDLTWISPEEAEGLDLPEVTFRYESAPITMVITNGDTVTVVSGLPPATVPVGDMIEHGPIPFTERERIIYQAAYGVPLRLKLMRDGAEIELVVVPQRPAERQLEPGQTEFPTPTLYPEGYHSF